MTARLETQISTNTSGRCTIKVCTSSCRIEQPWPLKCLLSRSPTSGVDVTSQTGSLRQQSSTFSIQESETQQVFSLSSCSNGEPPCTMMLPRLMLERL